MPYEWLPPETPDRAKVLHLWPYRSLPRRGFVVFIGVTCGLLFLPLIAVLGSPILWGLLPFLVGVVALTWFMIERSYKDGSILEELRFGRDAVTLTRQNPRAPRQDWSANPYWITVHLHPRGGPVEHYLTLRGNGREVEIGAFLTPEERLTLHEELQSELFALKTHGPALS
jgi:uncharacterized membrane protein